MKDMNQDFLNRAVSQQKTSSTTTNYSQSTDTLPHQVDNITLNLSIPDWINTKFQEAFSNKWGKKVLPSTWIQGISILTIEQIKKAVSHSLINGDGWPPSLPEFIKAGKNTGIDYDEAFDRMIRKEKDLSDVEYWAANEVGYKCRAQLPEDKARAVHKKAMDKYIKRQSTNSLPDRNVQMISQDPKTKKAGKDWLAPNGNYYRCPSEYYAEKLNNQ